MEYTRTMEGEIGFKMGGSASVYFRVEGVLGVAESIRVQVVGKDWDD